MEDVKSQPGRQGKQESAKVRNRKGKVRQGPQALSPCNVRKPAHVERHNLQSGLLSLQM